ncbi:MAG: helix-turn-helix domain-containing protein [Ruminococcaceae bacterium]|nr:helix-turn-helix domain-containing protein [Oscillospiraceae bacterium]
MKYAAELNLLQNSLRKCRINTTILKRNNCIDSSIDNGLRLLLNLKNEYKKNFHEVFGDIEEKIIYFFTDKFSGSYIFFLLPESNEDILLIGPFLKTIFTKEDVVFLMEQLKIDLKYLKMLENYYSGMPYVADSSFFFNFIEAFCEKIWQSAKPIQYIELEQDKNASLPILQNDENNFDDEEKTLINMKMMEARYAFENELINAVSRGQIHIVEKLISNFTEISFEDRINDKLRNYKNYAIIMNTILRKAAESGGVHPLYIDRVSSGFAKEIEDISNLSAISTLMSRILRKYCYLVKENSIKSYSAPVQKAIIFIDSDLTADLSLNHLAQLQNISPAYLSNIFHKETGEKLTDYVNKKRVNYAKQLLDTTNLQIQTIAQRCGIVDVHYFSRIFKKHTGKTPKEYRELQRKG